MEPARAPVADVPSMIPPPEEMRRLGYRVVDLIVEHLSALPTGSIGRVPSRQAMEALLREPLPAAGQPLDDLLAEFSTKVLPNALYLNHPRFFGFIPSAPAYAAVLGDLLAAGINFFCGAWLESAGPSQLEILVLDWFKELLGYPAAAGGILVSGGSVANLTALAVARRVQLDDDPTGATVYCSDQTHASVDRALRILGFRPDQLRRVPTDDAYRLQPDALARQIDADRAAGARPAIVIANAGTTNTGAVDPIAAIAEVARARHLWLHVDGAYGGFAVLSARGRALLAGIEQADSIVLDPHKWLYTTFEVGCVLVREAAMLRETFRILPAYLRDVDRGLDEVNFCDYGIQLTRGCRALKIWLALKHYGIDAYRALVDRCLDLAQAAAARIAASPVLEVVTPPQLGVVCFRATPRGGPAESAARTRWLDAINAAVVDALVASGDAFVSSTRLGDRTVLRLCILNHQTTAADLERTIALVEQAARNLAGSIGDAPTEPRG